MITGQLTEATNRTSPVIRLHMSSLTMPKLKCSDTIATRKTQTLKRKNLCEPCEKKKKKGNINMTKFTNFKVVKPEDLNHYGYLFGGKLLLWIDEYSWIAATLDFPSHNFVTRSMDNVKFKKSVQQGSILTFKIDTYELGKAYVKYKVTVDAKNQSECNAIFETIVTFVSVDKNGKIKLLKK